MGITIAILMVLGLALLIVRNQVLIKRWYILFPIVALLYSKALIHILGDGDLVWAISAYCTALILLFAAAKIPNRHQASSDQEVAVGVIGPLR